MSGAGTTEAVRPNPRRRGVRRNRRVVLLAGIGVTGLALVLSSCGDSSSKSTTTTTEAHGSDTSTSAPASAAAAEIAKRGEPTVTKVDGPVTELKVTDDVVGTGKEAKAGDTVTAQYVGAVAESGKVFQSSWKMGGAIQFSLDQVIPGWAEGIPGMKEGGRRTLVIPAAMAYGANPPPGSGIPPNADLIFVVDLVAVD